MAAKASTLLIPTQSGVVPVDPDQQPNARAEQEREEAVDCPELINYIKRTVAAVKKLRDADWQAILDSQVRCVAYYNDRQYGKVVEGVFKDHRREPGDIRPVDNQYKIQVDKLTMEFSRAFPDIKVTASDTNNSQMVEAAKFAQSRVNANRRQLLKNGDRLREAQALLLKACTWRYTYFNEQAKDSPMERRERRSTKTYGQARSMVVCRLCGMPMKPVMNQDGAGARDEYECISCGSNRQKKVGTEPQQAEMVDGYDQVPGGRVETRHVDPTMVRISLSARREVADSSFLWYHQRVERHILEGIYHEFKIKNSGGDLNMADRYKADAEGPSNTNYASTQFRDGGNNEEGQDGGDQFEECPYDLFWIDLSVYGRKKFPRPQKLFGGRVLPANTELGKMFGEGLRIAMNADQVLDLYGEDKNQKWDFCVYGVREHALVGSGTNSLLGPQDTRNDLKACLIANVFYNASSREFIRDGAFTGNRLPNLNEAAVIVDIPDEKPVEGWAHSRSDGKPLPDQVVGLYQSEAGALQEGAGTSSLSSEGAAPDLRKALGTATGVAAMRDQAVGRMGPNLMLLTGMEEEWSYKVLCLELENFSEERFLKMANQSIAAEDTDGSITFSAEGIKTFRRCNPRTDFNIEAVQGSWMPRTEAERQANLGAFSSFVAQVNKALGSDPRAMELIAMAADILGIPIDFGGWTSTEHVAAARIRAFARTVETYEKRGQRPITPELIQSVINSAASDDANTIIDNEMDNHGLFMDFYQRWWASDEGQSCSPLLRAVIKTEHVLHRRGAVFQGTEKNKDTIATEAPKQLAAQAAAADAAPNPEDATKAKISESMNYKDLPAGAQAAMLESVGLPSDGAGVEDDGTAAVTAKTQGALAVQEHKSQLETDAMKEQARIDLEKTQQAAALQEELAQAEHARTLQAETHRQDHEAGMKGAELAVKSAEGAATRHHQATESESERRAEAQRTASEQQHDSHEAAQSREHERKQGESEAEHKERLARMKPGPATKRSTK